MKVLLRSFPAFLALVVLGAHFYRAGLFPLVVVCLLALGLLFIRKPWATWTLRAMLVAGAFEWLRTAQRIAAFREQAGQPATRMWVILGAVAAFTALAAWVLPGAREGNRKQGV
jgi:hypothetical protein